MTGLIAAVGVTMPALMTPPDLAAPVLPPDAGELLLEFAPPHAAMIAVMSGIDSPTTAPRRTNSLRLRRPAASSSMKLFSRSELCLRISSSLR